MSTRLDDLAPLPVADRRWFIDQYDQYVASCGHAGATLKESREAVAAIYAREVAAGRLLPAITDRRTN